MAVLGLPKIITEKAWKKVTRNSQRQKTIISNTP